MNRRQLLKVVSIGVTGGFAGCLNQSSSTTQPTTTLTTHQETETVHEDGGGRLYLEIDSKAKEKVQTHLTLTDLSSGSVVFDQTHVFKYNGYLDLSDKFENGKTYLFKMSVNGDVRFKRKIYPYDSYTLELRSDSKVVVLNHETVTSS